MVTGRKLTVLIVGSGGREHALAWKLAQSPQVGALFVAPGNAGTADCATNVAIGVEEITALADFAQKQQIDLTVVGPEVPLALGIVDVFQSFHLPIFGPSQAAAQLESSKAFAKSFMEAHDIPTAAYAAFSDYELALDYVQQQAGPLVVKASGLAAGKGVIVCDDVAAAETAVRQIMQERQFGAAGDEVIIEACLRGPEVSLLAFTDGRVVVPMLPARDHKRIYEADQGPNTGGMGAYAPPPDVTPSFVDEVSQRVLEPAIAGMAQRGTPYVGVLYAGLMLTADGPKVLEFNCRFGDPETQVVLPLLASDLAEIMLACMAGRLTPELVRCHPGACASVVMAAPGYPGRYPKGLPITGVAAANELDQVVVFHAGTAYEGEQLVTSGGRVLAVSAWGDGLDTAVAQAYAGVQKIEFQEAYYRSDIGRSVMGER